LRRDVGARRARGGKPRCGQLAAVEREAAV
jgi:hypothetical protein